MQSGGFTLVNLNLKCHDNRLERDVIHLTSSGTYVGSD